MIDARVLPLPIAGALALATHHSYSKKFHPYITTLKLAEVGPDKQLSPAFQKPTSDMNVNILDHETREVAHRTYPACQSKRAHLKNTGRNLGSAIGTVAGAAAGASAALSGAEVGALIGLVGGPAGAAIGGLAGAIFGGLFGASAGCIGGAKVGETIDRTALENLVCLDCGHSFS